MGYYLEVPEPLNKAEQLIKLYDAKKIPRPLFPVPEGEALVLVVKNEHFEVAGYIFNKKEFLSANSDKVGPERKRTWLLIDKGKVIKNILDNYGIDLTPKIKPPSKAKRIKPGFYTVAEWREKG